MRKYHLLILLFFFMAMIGCEDVERGVPVQDGERPSPVTEVKVENVPGGAVVTYLLPKNEDVLYVEAEYSLRDTPWSKKTSYLDNVIALEGFPDTLTHSVNLYSVSRSGLKSDPMKVTIKPLLPPVITVSKTLSFYPTFGGLKVEFENESEANLKLIVLTPDSLGDLYTPYIHYTKSKGGNFSVRGFDAVERTFGVYVLDRWNNYSDTLYATVTPWYEEKLNKADFSAVTSLTGDVTTQHTAVGGSINSLWDDVWNVGSPVFHTAPNSGIPQSFTINLKHKFSLSRMKLYHRSSSGTDGQYSAGAPKRIEIYGSNTLDPDWNTWTSLGTFTSVKPSGSAGTSWTAEDRVYACEEGEDFEFATDEAFQYIRFRIMENWGGVSYIYLGELTFWGAPAE